MSTTKTYRFLQTNPNQLIITANNNYQTTTTFEHNESDLWSFETGSSTTPRPPPSSSNSPDHFLLDADGEVQMSKTPSMTGVVMRGPASLPVNVPDWSKILKGEYRDRISSRTSKYSYYYGFIDEDVVDENGVSDVDHKRVPPHEYLARNRMASLSVHEGIGRTLKGRDLSRVRNAVWQITGFLD